MLSVVCTLPIPLTARTLAGNHHVRMESVRGASARGSRTTTFAMAADINARSRQFHPLVAAMKAGEENSGLTGIARILVAV